MNINYNVTGSDRQKLVRTISRETGENCRRGRRDRHHPCELGQWLRPRGRLRHRHVQKGFGMKDLTIRDYSKCSNEEIVRLIRETGDDAGYAQLFRNLLPISLNAIEIYKGIMTTYDKGWPAP